MRSISGRCLTAALLTAAAMLAAAKIADTQHRSLRNSIVLYEKKGFGGESAEFVLYAQDCITPAICNIGHVANMDKAWRRSGRMGFGDWCSSAQASLDQGVVARLYEHRNFKGRDLWLHNRTTISDMDDYQFGDVVSSLKWVLPSEQAPLNGLWQLYSAATGRTVLAQFVIELDERTRRYDYEARQSQPGSGLEKGTLTLRPATSPPRFRLYSSRGMFCQSVIDIECTIRGQRYGGVATRLECTNGAVLER